MLSTAASTEKLLKRYEVDLVIVMVGFMDVMATPGDAVFSPAALDRLRKLEPAGGKYQLAKLSHLARIWRNGKTARIQRAKQKDLAQLNYYRDFLRARGQFLASRPALDGFTRTGDDPLKNYLLGLDALAAAAKQNGAKLLLVGEPTLYKSSLGPTEANRLVHFADRAAEVEAHAAGVRPILHAATASLIARRMPLAGPCAAVNARVMRAVTGTECTAMAVNASP